MERRSSLQTRSSGLASTSTAYEETRFSGLAPASTAYEETTAFPAMVKQRDKCDNIVEASTESLRYVTVSILKGTAMMARGANTQYVLAMSNASKQNGGHIEQCAIYLLPNRWGGACSNDKLKVPVLDGLPARHSHTTGCACMSRRRSSSSGAAIRRRTSLC